MKSEKKLSSTKNQTFQAEKQRKNKVREFVTAFNESEKPIKVIKKFIKAKKMEESPK